MLHLQLTWLAIVALSWFLVSPLTHLVLVMTLCFIGWFTFSRNVQQVSILSCIAMVLFGHMGVYQSIEIILSHPVRLLVVGCLISEVIVRNNIHLLIASALLQGFKPKTEVSLISVLFVCSGFLSMWISNTSAVAMLIPVVLEISRELKLPEELLLLSVAYGSTVGGMLTPIGTPANLVAIAYAERYLNIHLNFVTWFMWTAPFALMMAFCVLGYFYTIGHKNAVVFQKKAIKVDYPQLKVIFGLLTCVVLWATQSVWSVALGFSIPEEWIGVVFLYVCSQIVYKDRYAFYLSDIWMLPFSSIAMVVTGIFMADALMGYQVIELLLAQINSGMLFQNYQVLSVFGFLISCMTELCSNTAVASLALPLSLVMVKISKLDVMSSVILITLSANSAFMLPTATPPNALVLGTGKISSKRLIFSGFLLSLCSLMILTALFS